MRNPWDRGLIIGALVLIGVGGGCALALLVAVAAGVRFTDHQPSNARWYALGMLVVVAAIVFVAVMAERWRNHHTGHAE